MKYNLYKICVVILLLLSRCTEPTKQPLSPRINHVMLYVSDLENSIDFYTRAFDLVVTNRLDSLTAVQPDGSEVTRPVKMAFLKFPGQDFVFELSQQPRDTTSITNPFLFQHVGVDVTDIDTAFKRAVEVGGDVLLQVRTVKAKGIEAKQAFLAGPDGERIELMQIISGEF
jgi:catechol 2,3-dioxygenase-like lactoylglutathione lyase family enzyme